MELTDCECEFLRDGTLVDRGVATTALGGPVPALVWLLTGLPDGLRAGDIITTGSMIGATPVAPGQRWTNRLHGPASSSVEITFT
jgi:2-keto-4-pentenoate hydratase